MTEQINHIPVVPLRGLTVFPGMAVHFDVIRMKSIEGIQQAMLAGQKVFLIRQKDEKVEEPDKDALCHGGVLAEIRPGCPCPAERHPGHGLWREEGNFAGVSGSKWILGR
ncbi:MAG: LON peptidase substrate-binding domain-containing protein [Sellimonas intestinalis]